MEQTPSPDTANDSTPGLDPDSLRRELREARHEAASYRIKLRELERQRSLSVAAWRPSTDPRTDGLIGYADLRLGDLLIFDVRLIRREGVFGLSWPARKPMGSDRLAEIMRPSPGLDARALATILERAFPETTVELPG